MLKEMREMMFGPIIAGQDSQFHPSNVYLRFFQLNLKIRSNFKDKK